MQNGHSKVLLSSWTVRMCRFKFDLIPKEKPHFEQTKLRFLSVRAASFLLQGRAEEMLLCPSESFAPWSPSRCKLTLPICLDSSKMGTALSLGLDNHCPAPLSKDVIDDKFDGSCRCDTGLENVVQSLAGSQYLSVLLPLKTVLSAICFLTRTEGFSSRKFSSWEKSGRVLCGKWSTSLELRIKCSFILSLEATFCLLIISLNLVSDGKKNVQYFTRSNGYFGL